MNQQAIQNDQRQFSRFAFDSSVILEKEKQLWESSLLDISLKGVLIAKPENWEKNAEGNFKLSIKLENSDIEINMDVKFAHEEKDYMGFHCEQIDLDSMTNLRRLVELNLADEALLEREISNMLAA